MTALGWLASLPPVGRWEAGLLAAASLGWLCAASTSRRRRLADTALVGLVVFGVTLRWVGDFSVVAAVVLTALQAGIFATAALLLPSPPRRRLLALPGAVVLVEGVRQAWPLSGLPLSSWTLGQVDGPLLGWAAVGGPLLVTAATMTAGVLLAAAVRRDLPAAVAAVGLGALVVGPLLLSQVSWTRPVGTVTLGLVQGGGGRGDAAISDVDLVLRRHLRASQDLDGPDLVLWPENAVDDDDLDGQRVARVRRLAVDLGVPILAGVTIDAGPATGAGPDGFRNLAVLVGAAGDVVDVYDKVERVPFGEYVPWRSVVQRLADVSEVPRDAVPGVEPGLVRTSAGPLGVSISFEGLFAGPARRSVLEGAEVLVNPTNASSYRTDDVPGQQVAAARLRAVETGRWLAIAGPTGPTAVVDPDGRVVQHLPLGAAGTIERTVDRRVGETPYVRYGDVPVLVLAVLVVGLAARPVTAVPGRPSTGPSRPWRGSRSAR